MKLKVMFFGIALTAAILPKAFSGFDGYVTLSADSVGGLASTANVSYTFDVITCTNCTYQMIGDHKILESNGGGVVTQRQWGVYSTQYRNILNGGGAPGSCYFATNNASLTGQPPDAWAPSIPIGSGGPWQSSSACIAAPPPPPPEPLPSRDPIDVGMDAGAYDPIVISLNGPYTLSAPDDPVSFDINASGQAVKLCWTARDTDIAFLALDRNGNGQIDNASELFGNGTPLRQGGRAANGFDVVAEYDRNGDGVVDAADPVWTDLLLWVDANHDGVSEPNEVRHLSSSAITGIEVQHHWTGRRDRSGNWFGYEGHLHEGKRVRSFYDVFFATVP
jgi:hypothetical protein